MTESKKRLYEGLFLINQNAASADFTACMQHVRQILDRAEAEVVVIRKWDERKLAYEIEGQSRGAFLLAFFNVDPSRLMGIERDCNLSETVLRVLVLRADYAGEAEIEMAKKEREIAATEMMLRGGPGGAEAMAIVSSEDGGEEMDIPSIEEL
jgi:small subunit ribosomal protein S6